MLCICKTGITLMFGDGTKYRLQLLVHVHQDILKQLHIATCKQQLQLPNDCKYIPSNIPTLHRQPKEVFTLWWLYGKQLVSHVLSILSSSSLSFAIARWGKALTNQRTPRSKVSSKMGTARSSQVNSSDTESRQMNSLAATEKCKPSCSLFDVKDFAW